MKTWDNIQVIHFQKNKIKKKSKCIICLTGKTFIDEIEGEYDLEPYLQFFTDINYKNEMKTWVKCKKDTENLSSKIFKTKNNRLIMQSKCNDCGITKSWFMKEQKSKRLLSNLGIKTSISKIALLNLLF